MIDLKITLKTLYIIKEVMHKVKDFELNMVKFGGIDSKPLSSLKIGEINECGTDCCVLGKMPEFIPIQKSDFIKSSNDFSYKLYSDRIMPYFAEEEKIDEWDYLFGGYNPDSKIEFLERLEVVISSLEKQIT